MPPRIAAFANEPGCSARCPRTCRRPASAASSCRSSRGTPTAPTHQAAIMLFDPDTGIAGRADGRDVRHRGAHRRCRRARREAARARGRARARHPRHRRPVARGAGDVRRASATSPRFGSPGAASSRRPCAAPTSSPATTAFLGAGPAAEWLGDGAHVSSVGYNTAGSELDPAIVERATCLSSSPATPRSPRRRAARPSSWGGIRPRSSSSGSSWPAVGPAEQRVRNYAVQVRRRRDPGPRRGSARVAAARERNIGLEFELEEMHA